MKNAIVTGGTKGIGEAIVEMLLHEGYFVYTTYATDSIAAKKAAKIFSTINSNYKIEQINQSDSKAIHRFTNSLSNVPIHCIVCNAGATLRKPLITVTDTDWERVMQIGVHSHFYLIRDLFRQIQPESRIIFIGSMMAVQPHATSLAYGTMKGAIHAMAKNLVKEFDGTNTTVNVIAPGFVDTEWQKEKKQSIRESICSKTAIHRFAEPKEIAETARHIIHNGFINGAIIEVSGGYNYK